MLLITVAAVFLLAEPFKSDVAKAVIYTVLVCMCVVGHMDAWVTVGFKVICLTLGLSYILTAAVTSINPADDSIREIVKDRLAPDFFKDSKHPHVITQDFFCNICEHVV